METQKIQSRMKVTHYDFDPDATTATDVGWVDMRDFGRFLASFFRTIGTSALVMKILGNSASDGSGTDVTVKTKTLTSAEPNALGDYTFIECNAQEIKAAAEAAGEEVRYLSLNLAFATATDEGVVTYIRSDPRFAHDALTADNIA